MIQDTKSNMEIDTNLYSRQIGTFGMEAMGKLIQMKILIHGLRGLGVEIAKNIILAGPKSVALHDPSVVTINDLGSNFYLNESHIGSVRRDVASVNKLAELNPYVCVDVLSNVANLEDVVADYNVVVITEVLPRETVEKLDKLCRENKAGFIYCASLGITGFAFVDFGEQHMIRDENGEECKQYIIRNISRDEKGIVLIDDSIGTGKLALSDGDHVAFREVQGMTELNDGVPREIKYVSPIAFSIGDTSKYGEFVIGGGIVEQVKVPKPHFYKSLRDSFESPYNGNRIPDPIDFAKFGRNELLHCGVLALHEFVRLYKFLPELNNQEHAQEVLKIAKSIYDNGKVNNVEWVNNSEEFDEQVILSLASWSRSHIVPVTSFLGGVVAQEIVKFTGKYSPINQWLWFDFYECVANLKSPCRVPQNSRYDDQIAIFGTEIQEKLHNLNIFMIGAGALGCEFLKEFALMGISTKAKTFVTDNDNIEISNLNRQFLFRRENVGGSKSKTACEVVRKMNSEFVCYDLQSRVGAENVHIFNSKFWNSQDFVINAVDNVHARRYIDSMCTWYGKPLIDSGTLGTKAHVQMIVPHVTSCYNDTQDPPEESIPMCTLRNFPALIEHCIEWGRDHFNGYFTNVVKDAHRLLTDPNGFYSDLKKEGNTSFQLDKVMGIKRLVEVASTRSFEKCIELAVERFTENYDHAIKQLLHSFPPEYVNPDGSKFWSGSKRVPTPITYNAHDSLHFSFVSHYAVILARCLSINPGHLDYIKQYSESIRIPGFVPKNLKIQVNENDPVEVSIGKDDETQISSLINELSLYDRTIFDANSFKQEEFEKDDDANGHIDFITAASNLRARNYRIGEADRQKTKMIAGKIIPAIATTTAAITGLVALQIYTVLQTNEIQYMKNAFMNLAVSLFVLTEPGEKILQTDKDYDPLMLGPVKAVPPKWTVWDKIVVDGPMTIRQFINYIQEKYAVDVSIITSNQITLIQTFMKSNLTRLDLKIEDVYVQHSKQELSDAIRYLVLEVSADTLDGVTALLPLVQYNFR
jgi:ubiquitin-activating enzyme E1